MALLDKDGYRIQWKETINAPKSPRFSLEADRSQCTRVVDVPWDYVENFCQAVLGFQSIGSISQTDYTSHVPTPSDVPFISRVIPWDSNFGLSANPSYLYASKIDVEGIGVPTDKVCIDGHNNDAIARYKTARCTILFTSRTYDIKTDAELTAVSPINDESVWFRYVTKVIRPQGELFTLNGGYFYGGINNAGNAMAVTTGLNKVILSYNLSITWHQIPSAAVPSVMFNPGCANAAIDNCLGCVNDSTFNGMKQGTLLLMAAEVKPAVSPLGQRIYDITYMFKYFRPQKTVYSYPSFPANFTITAGHNHTFLPPSKVPSGATNVGVDWYEAIADSTRAKTAPYTNFIAKLDGKNIYDFRDFKYLFRPATYAV